MARGLHYRLPDFACSHVKEIPMNAQNIREHMDVIGSCGNKLGRVDHVEGGSIKLTRDSSDDGRHHFVPMEWVGRVDQHVHLNKDCGEARRAWSEAPVGAGAG
jgi:hypothetical protein